MSICLLLGRSGHYGMYDGGRNPGHPDEDEGFDDHYFRRRPKSVCMSANSADGRRFIPPTYGGMLEFNFICNKAKAWVGWGGYMVA